jgi:hypothetical protein
MKLTRSATLLAAAVLTAAPALAAGPAYVGNWGTSAAQCKVPQDRQGAPMIVRAEGYDQHEAHCGWKIGAECLVEGDKQKDAFILTASGDTLTMRHGKASRIFKRCR